MVTVGMLASCYFFYPGCMSGDTEFSWNDAIYNATPHFSDFHPPLIAFSWWLLNYLPFTFNPRHANLFLVMNLLYWTGLMLAIRPWSTNKKVWLLAFICVCFFPPSLGIMSQPIKDSLMCAALMAAYGSLLTAERHYSKTIFGFGLFCLFLALGYRHNAVFAIFPLAIWAGFIFHQHTPFCTWWKKAMTGIVILLALLVGVSGLNFMITAQPSYPIQTLFTYDLVGITAKTGHAYLPELYNDDTKPFIFGIKGSSIKGDTVSVANIRQLYSTSTNMNIYWYGEGKGLRFLSNKDELATLRQAWINAVLQEPAAYLEVHLDLFLTLINLSPSSIWPYFCMTPPSKDESYNPTLPQAYLTYKDTWLFKGFTYLYSVTLLFALACWKRRIFPLHLRVLGSSGLIYGMSYFIVGVSSDFRYLYWLIAVSILMAINMVLFVFAQYKQRKAILL